MWWWDGAAWRPTPAQLMSAPADPRSQREQPRLNAQEHLDARHSPGAVKQPLTLNQLIGLLVAVVVLGGVAWVMIDEERKSNQREQDFQDLYCQKYGGDDC